MLNDKKHVKSYYKGIQSDLSTVGEVIHSQTAVQTESQPEVTEAQRQVVLHQDVGALQVPMHYGHL